MPISAVAPAQECHRSVLAVGTIGPASLPASLPAALPAAGSDGVVPAELGGATAVDAGKVQAVTAISAATAVVSAAALPRTPRPPRRGINMPPSCPKARPPRSGRGGALAVFERFAVLGDDQVGELLGRGFRGVLVQGDPAPLDQVDPVADLEDLAVVVRDDDDRDLAVLLQF